MGSIWSILKEFKKNGVEFVIEPYTRFENLPGEQKTLFFYDNSGNALEFKSFKNMEMLFSTELWSYFHYQLIYLTKLSLKRIEILLRD